MTPLAIVSLVGLLGWLVLALRNPEINRLGLQRGMVLTFVWVTLFTVVAIVIGQIM